MPKLKDSGERQSFSTGAIRDAADGKPMLGLISPLFERRLGDHLTAGAKKYNPRNWEKGIPVSRCYDSLRRHLNSFQIGEADEDHLAAAACNLMFILHYEEAVKRGMLPPELLDMPKYLKTVSGSSVKKRNEEPYLPGMEPT